MTDRPEEAYPDLPTSVAHYLVDANDDATLVAAPSAALPNACPQVDTAPRQTPTTPTPEDVAAWEKKYRPIIKGIFRRKLAEDVAKDLYQEFWLKVMRRRHTIRETHPRAIKSWLLKTAGRMIPDHYRHRTREKAARRKMGELVTPEREPTVRDAMRNEEGDPLDQLRRSMDSLPFKYRQAAEKTIMEGKTFVAWASEAGINRRTASARLTEALRRLRENMGDSPGELAG